MFLPDVNLWLALILSGHTHHGAARAWLDGVNTPGSVSFCRATQQALLRLLTTAAVFTPYGNAALTNREAWSVYAKLRKDDRIVFAEESAGLEAIWKSLAAGDAPSPKLWMDAYLAALAIDGNMRLVTFDKGFVPFCRKGLDLFLIP